MKNSFSAFLAIIGTVIGSGFITGKEIVVFFSRFGWFSFPAIILSFFLLFFLFRLILLNGDKALIKLKTSKISFFLNLFLCIIFSSAMFAGIGKTSKSLIVLLLVFLLCFFVFKKGMGGLNKINFVFVPIMSIVFLVLLLSSIQQKTFFVENSLGGLSIFYCLLYCVMNSANGGVLIAEYSTKLSRPQKTRVAFFSALALSGLLMLSNIVLLQNPSSFENPMPILSLFDGGERVVMTIMVFVGCLTTLLTLTYTLSSSVRGLCKSEIFNFFVSILLPIICSLLGFNFILEYLYPFASILSVYILYDLFFSFIFKQKFKSFKVFFKSK